MTTTQPALTIEQLRNELALTQSDFAPLLGLANKASVSLIERGGPCSVDVALALERLSKGRLDAGALNADVAKARAALVGTEAQDFRTDSAGSAIDDDPTDEELRIVLCDLCEHRVGAPETLGCTAVDCPNAERRAA